MLLLDSFFNECRPVAVSVYRMYVYYNQAPLGKTIAKGKSIVPCQRPYSFHKKGVRNVPGDVLSGDKKSVHPESSKHLLLESPVSTSETMGTKFKLLRPFLKMSYIHTVHMYMS